MSTETPRDWRGTPITPGALVVYGAPAGDSTQMVEATVAPAPFLTPSGRVRLDVIRRSVYISDRDRVSVPPLSLTVVTDLPPTTQQTDAEQRESRARVDAERKAIWDTHEVPEGWRWDTPCKACGTLVHQARTRRCEQ